MMQKLGATVGLLAGLGLSLTFVIGFAAGALFDRHEVTSQIDVSNPDIRNFMSAYRLVTQHSYYHPRDKHRLIYAAIDGMLSATGDPHTVFLGPAQNKVANAELNGSNFSGIGAIVVPTQGGLKVVSPVPGSPAIQAGLRPNDMITKIDGRSVSIMTGSAAIARIHGKVGTRVLLTMYRGRGAPFNVSVVRRQIQAITAYGRILAHRLGYIQIFSFGIETSKQVSAALHMLVSHHVRGIILDLRQNPGGYVDAAQNIVSQFLSSGTVAYEQRSDKTLTPLAVLGGKQLSKVPLAILVDEGSASAAEITAAALRDNRRAVLIGTRTYGKGSMQSVYSLADGSTVRITDRLWLTPKKESIGKVGLVPDILVRDTGFGGSGGVTDAQLARAERYLEQIPHR
ncbi:MAG: hypothetical protein NVSMB52_18280 [Chloroflexota bacterium]